ncbi:hypothetical protein GHT06_005392 [Daphnia sinensis]|uniref:Integrase catalytic domain-containing protein n=1 Tax=Daphnia sinensis TaxID=1820382 RepID=A0AAD5PKF9_9CRUS|nr:hypothetical protein GHT06_005392 [Daphnia sinensis]
MKREPEENMRRYANRIRKAFHKAYPMEGILDSATTASREQMMMDRFLEGLPSDVQIPLKYKKFASFDALIDRAELTALAVEESQTRVRIHAAYASTNVPNNQNELTSVLEALHRLGAKVDQNVTTQNMELQQSLAEMKRQLAHKPPQMGGKPRDPNTPSTSRALCRHSNGTNRRPAVAAGKLETTEATVGPLGGCPKPQQFVKSVSTQTTTPRIRLRIGNCSFKALVDSGAGKSLISSRLFEKLQQEKEEFKHTREVAVNLFDISNRRLVCQGTVTVDVLVEDERPREPFRQEFIVVPEILEECVLGNNHILVITDYFTKWVEVIPLSDQTALSTSKALVDRVILYHGPPRAIVTDRGSNFTSELFSSLCRALQIKQMKTTAYHPQTNGLTERFNKTVVEMLRKYIEQGFSKWEEVLGPVAFAYRNSVHSSTLETPYFLNHGRDPVMPIDQFLRKPSNIITPSDYKSQLMQRLHEAFLVHVNRIKPLYESMIWKDEPCVDFQESHNHTVSPALANELETPRPTEEEYPLQEDRDLIDLDAGLPSPSEGMETPNLHDEPALDSSPPPKQPPSTALEPVAPPIPVVAPRPERRPGLRPWSVLRPPNCLDTLFVMSLLALLSPTPLAAFNATVCDCDGAPNLGFLEFTEEDCSFEAAPTPPVPITYAIYSTLPEDFMQWNQVSHGRQPIEVDAATCRRMRDSRQCRGKAMDITGPNSFSLEGHPFVETSWLRTATEKMTNCRLEEVTLQSECPNCTISSPLGDIPGAINGLGVKYSTENDTTFRIRDPTKQLDFIYSTRNISVCGGGNITTYHPVLGMDKVVIAVRETAQATDLVAMKPDNADAVAKMALSELTRAEIEYASHTQYIRDFAMDISNHLAREIRNLQCESRKTAYHAATTTAQYDGWLAARHLDLPLCTKLLAVGASVSVLQCSPRNVTFETVFTPCGAQPRWGNQTINIEGWELTKYSECYWHANFVNFNGKAHTFKNNTWMPINPNLAIQGRRFIDTMPLEVDNSLGMILQLHPTITSHPLSASTIMADILAYIQMGYVTEMSGERHVNTVLVHPGQAKDVSFMARLGSWIRNFGIMSGVGVSIALAFRFCGLGSLLGLYIPCCRYFNPCSWLTPPQTVRRDIESEPKQPPTWPQLPPLPLSTFPLLHNPPDPPGGQG